MKINKTQKINLLLLFIFGFLFIGKVSYALTWVQMQDQIKDNAFQIEDIKNNITGIESKFTDLKDNYKLLYDGAKNQNDQLGNQISFAGYLVSGLSLIFTILGIFLALYINYQYRKIKEMKDIVEKTKNYIDGHNIELYERIRRDDTLGLLNRLREVPEDIGNICELLLSRELLEGDYGVLKEAYIKMKNDTSSHDETDDYISLMMQHFPYQSLNDNDLKMDIISHIDLAHLDCMFKRDIEKFFDQIFKFLQESGITGNQSKSIIKNLFYNYSKSIFQADVELKKHIKRLFTKYRLNKTDICNIAKEQAPSDTIYIAWLDSLV